MVTRYDVRWSSKFLVKLCVFAFLGEISRNCTQKAVKRLIMSFSMTRIDNFQFSLFFDNF